MPTAKSLHKVIQSQTLYTQSVSTTDAIFSEWLGLVGFSRVSMARVRVSLRIRVRFTFGDRVGTGDTTSQCGVSGVMYRVPDI